MKHYLLLATALGLMSPGMSQACNSPKMCSGNKSTWVCGCNDPPPPTPGVGETTTRPEAIDDSDRNNWKPSGG